MTSFWGAFFGAIVGVFMLGVLLYNIDKDDKQ